MLGLSEDDYQERLIGDAPVTVRRRVIWGECDPAQVVYTPRFADFVASATGWFWRVIMRGRSPDLESAGLLTPVKHLSLTFHHVLKPHDIFDMTVLVPAMRTRSLDLAIEATGMDGTAHFSATLSPILVSADAFQAIPIPEHVRQAIVDYQERCG